METGTRRVGRAWWDRHSAWIGVGLIALSLAASAALAMRSAEKPASGFETGFFVVLAAGFQLGSAYMFSRRGRADPAHVNSSFRRLAKAAVRAGEARVAAQAASVEGAKIADVKRTMLILSRDLSFIEEDIVEAGEDWVEVHPELSEEAQFDPDNKRSENK